MVKPFTRLLLACQTVKDDACHSEEYFIHMSKTSVYNVHVPCVPKSSFHATHFSIDNVLKL